MSAPSRAAWLPCGRSRGRGGRCGRPRSRPRPPGRRSPGWPRRAGRWPSRSRRTAARRRAPPRCGRRPRCFAPRRSSSLTCMKRFSKMVSVTRAVPSAMQFSAMNCACMSVGNSGYSLVRKLTALRPAARRARGSSRRRTRSSTPASRSLSITASRWSARASLQQHVAARRRHRAQEGAGLDAVGHDAVRLRARAAAPRPGCGCGCRHGLRCSRPCDQHLGQVGDLGLLRGVLQHRLAFGQRRGHQQVLGAGDGDHVGGDARALQPRGVRARRCSRARPRSRRPSPAGP